MIKILVNMLRICICAVLTVQLMGCGTLLYPERRGQMAGKIDAGIAVLDGIGLLFFLIPGVIAFAVDFGNGTIYLPGTRHGSLDIEDLKQVRFDSKHSGAASLAQIIKKQTGQELSFDQPGITISRLQSAEEMVAEFSKVLPDPRTDQIVILERK